MLRNSWISKNFSQNETNFIGSKQQATLRKLFRLHQIKASLKQKICYGDIQEYIQLLSNSFQNAALRRLEMVLCKRFFSATNQKYVYWKFCKVNKVFSCVVGVHFLQCWVSWGPKVEWGFWAKLYCKMSDLLAGFCWLWDFLLENLKLKDKL